MRGRKPKPTSLHLLNGNPSKKTLKNTGEPLPLPIVPACPTWLKPEGKKLWKGLVPELERMNILTMVDGGALSAACQSWAVYLECERFFKQKDEDTGKVNGRTYQYTNKLGFTNVLPRPEVAIGQRALADYKGFITEFGLTPASRTRINVAVGGNSKGKKKAGMLRLLSGVDGE